MPSIHRLFAPFIAFDANQRRGSISNCKITQVLPSAQRQFRFVLPNGTKERENMGQQQTMKWIAGLVFAFASVTPGLAADEKANVDRLAQGWMADFNAKNAEAMANRYAENAAVSFAPWGANGRAAIKAGFEKDWAMGVKFDSVTTEDATRDGDIVYSRGAYKVTSPMGPLEGHWMAVSKCPAPTSDTCPIVYHFGNVPLPAPK
jgi:ketosteroid isomerase-like protein